MTTYRAPAPAASMLDYCAARAAYSDDVYRQPERQQDLAFLHTWLPQRLSGRSVVEVACGTGYWTQFVAGAASEVVAVDAAS
jgi:demethylmenaquinone methyltransferase/2-methoxy-6-polyprenyl-1,4-benzoquinol methylase